MRSGVGFPSYGRRASWTGSGISPSFPAANLSTIDQPRRVMLQSAPGTLTIDFVLPAAEIVDFIALAHHNGPAGATMAIQLSSGTNPETNLVHNVSGIPVWPAGGPLDGYLPCRPYRISSPATVRSGRITLTGNPGAWEIGAVEIGRWWSWLDVGVDREIGFATTSQTFTGASGADHVTGSWAPRTARGQRKVVDREELDTTLMDFRQATGLSKAFIFAWDLDDPSTWARECFLVKNANLPAAVTTDPESGSLRYEFEEALL